MKNVSDYQLTVKQHMNQHPLMYQLGNISTVSLPHGTYYRITSSNLKSLQVDFHNNELFLWKERKSICKLMDDG